MDAYQALLILAIVGLLIGGMISADGCCPLVLIEKKFVPPIKPDFQMKPVTPVSWRRR